MEKEITEKKADNAAEASTKSLPSGKKTKKSLKAKSKIAKKSPTSTFPKKAKGALQDHENNRNNKENNVLKGKKESSKTKEEDAQNPNSRKEKLQKNVNDEMHNRDGHLNKDTQEKVGGLKKRQEIRNNKEKRDGSEKSLKRRKYNEKRDGLGKSRQNEERKERLGGLIFMCNSKTKPDCFRYRVMGVSTSKKDLVLGAKPGLKLFLYDFDLKLMYGIYKASSSGGMKLEPKAFGGAFPVQVRFNIHEDCYPLPESVFKKAINENFTSRHKFKTELTVRQVRKLSELFRPIKLHALPVHNPPMAAIQDREVHQGVRESWPHSHRETSTGDHYANAVGRSYPHHVAPTMDPYQGEREREHFLRHPDTIYRDTVPAQREHVRADPLYLNEREYRIYGLGARPEVLSATDPATATTSTATVLDSYSNDPYNTYHYAASYADPYLPPPRRDVASSGSYSLGVREAYLTETDHSRRREANQVERLYPTYASNALLDYNQRPHYQEARHEPALAPVSSRYSFAGPSISYR